MHTLHFREGDPPQQRCLPEDVAVALNQLEVAVALPAGGGSWSVSNIRKVGVIRVGEYQIQVQPKVSTARLFFMMGYSAHRDFWKDQDILVDADDDFLETITQAFIQQATRATASGLLQGYETLHEALPLIRGRIDVSAQINHRAGLPLPMQVTFDEYSTNIAENQLISAAAHRLLHISSLNHQARKQLGKLVQRLDGVALLQRGAPLPQVHFTRLNSRYRNALILAELILKNSSLEQRLGHITATAFLFDMWQIFEDFVTTTLAENFRRISGTAQTQARGRYLDSRARLALRPDLLWMNGSSVLAVIDAKYKAPKASNYPNADIYQMLAYCMRFGLRAGHLIYAQGEEHPQIHEILGRNTTIHCHAIALDQTPAALLEQISRLATRISVTAGSGNADG
jgi:5-methylcytosine-specific restriction enzyme subunit McrC